MHTTAGNSFLVYWQQAGAQLFAFTVRVQADTRCAARAGAVRTIARKGRVLGVKQSAGTGLHTLNRGRWIG